MSNSMQLRFTVLALAGFLSGCQPAESPILNADASATVHANVVVTSQVLLEMTQAVCNDGFGVVKVIPDGVSSLNWEPSGGDVRVLQRAKLILISGAGYEPWQDRVALPGSRVRDTSVGYYEQFIRIPDAISHQHGPAGKHDHPGTVWATWLDPDLAMAQLQQVANECIRIMPAERTGVEAATAKLKAQLGALNPLVVVLRELRLPEDFQVFADGPFYQYLTTRLSWPLRYMHWQHQTAELSAANRQELNDVLTNSPGSTRSIFLMSTTRDASVEQFVASTGLTVVRIDLCEFPLDRVVPLADRLRGNLERLKAAVNP